MWHKAREIDGKYKISASKVVQIVSPIFAKYYNVNRDEITYTEKEKGNGVLAFELSFYVPYIIDEETKTKQIRQYLPRQSKKIVIIEHTKTMCNGKFANLNRYLISVYFNKVEGLPTEDEIRRITADIEQILTNE